MTRWVASLLFLLPFAASGAPIPAPYTAPSTSVTVRTPLPTDDTSRGYAIGNIWVAPGGAVYQAQQVTLGHAVWTPVSASITPVDAVGGAAPIAAYGTRRLRVGYTGYALHVFAGSDTTGIDVGFAPDGSLDTATLDAYVAAQGATFASVGTWYDQSGNGNNATQATAAYRPSLYSVSLTGNARSVVFDSNINAGTTVQRWMAMPSGVAAAGNSVSVFVAGRAYSSERGAYFTQLTNASFPQILKSGNTAAPETLSFTYGSGYLSTGVPPQSPSVVGYVSATTGITVINGPLTSTFGAQANQAMAGGYLGAVSANISSGPTGYVEMGAVLVYGRGLSAASEIPALQSALNKAFALTPQVRDVFCADGDSITEGYQSTLLFNRPRQVQALLIRPMAVYDKGYFGDTMAHRATNYSADVAPIYNSSAINNIVSIFAGTNDINGSSTDVTVENAMTSYVSQAHATGWKVVIGTILPRSGWTTQQSTYAANVNSWIRAGSSGADAVADYAADPTMGNSANVTNTLLYADGTHPTNLGYGYLAQIEAAAVNGLVQ